MSCTSSQADTEILRQTYHHVVRLLIEKYDWALLSQDALVEMALGINQSIGSPDSMERVVIGQYNITLYEACYQAENLERRERGYTELFRYLYRAAYNRWPDLAEDVTQQALLLVYERIEHCKKPASFRSFAVYQLLWAHKELVSKTRGNVPIDEMAPDNMEEPPITLDTTLVEEERLQIVLDAINRLPEQRQRDVIFLRFFKGLSDAEISEHLNITANHVRVLRNRALNRLRKDKPLREYFGKTKSEANLNNEAG